ncbi:MAG: adenine phosphoribosyltransferase [Thermoplasmatales archaeon]|nr:adenine phosphoribosyltransferase [Thermoplasmatales archaeon]
MNLLEKSLKEAPIIKKGEYNYIIHPITDGIPFVEPKIIEEIVDEIIKEMPSCNRILTIEAMGIPIATVLSLKTGLPFTIVRKRKYSLPGEKEVIQKTGYSETRLYINGIKKGDEVLIVDDVISTGGTLIAIVESLKEIGAKIKGIFVAINKGNKEEIEKKIGMRIRTLVNIEVNHEVRIL